MFPADDIADIGAQPAEGGGVWEVKLPQEEAGVPNPRLALLGGGVFSAELTCCCFFVDAIIADDTTQLFAH